MSMSQRMHPDDLAAILSAVEPPCRCPFTEEQSQRLAVFAGTLNDDGLKNWVEVLALGATVRQAKKVGMGVVVSTLIGAMILALWSGIKRYVMEG